MQCIITDRDGHVHTADIIGRTATLTAVKVKIQNLFYRVVGFLRDGQLHDYVVVSRTDVDFQDIGHYES